MKTLWVVLLLALLPLLTGAAPAPAEVVLTARDVASALDIEEAIKVATNWGTRPGVVTLDARDGPFTYTQPDQSINIFYSGVTLRSLSGATITNCADGVFFDDLPLHDVAVRGITFRCGNSGFLIGWANHEARRVMIQDNTFDVQAFGIGIALGRDVVIVRNAVTGANADAINLVRPTNARILGNDLHGSQGVLLDGATDSEVTGNDIDATGLGVVLQQGCDDNKVDGNRISGVHAAGIVFEGDSSGNKVHGNWVTCAPGADCLAVDASPAAWEANQISGNKIAD